MMNLKWTRVTPSENKLRVLELFGGIGACSSALERLNIPFTIADYVEIDKYAVQSFNAIHNTNFEPQDITKWDKDIEVDFIMHGSPCQDFSVAGLGKGGDEGSGTRSSLMYESIRIIKKLNPKYVCWENVKNLLSVKHRHNFDAYLQTMEELGYNNFYAVLNTKDYGVPQNRERVFTVSIRKDLNKDFTFPQPFELTVSLKDLLEKEVDDKYILSEKAIKYVEDDYRISHKITQIDGQIGLCLTTRDNHTGNFERTGTFGATGVKEYKIIRIGKTKSGGQKSDIISDEGLCTCLSATDYKQPKQIGDSSNYVLRKLTPLECFRLQGFSDEQFYRAENVCSNTQLYKQAGNSITVDVLYYIFKNLLGDNHEV